MSETGEKRTGGNQRNKRSKRHGSIDLRVSTGTSIALIVQMDVDRVTEFTTELLGLFLREGTAGDH